MAMPVPGAGPACGFAPWTAPLVLQKEPGAWAHNFEYMAELLIDSTADLGGDVTALTRP